MVGVMSDALLVLLLPDSAGEAALREDDGCWVGADVAAADLL